MLRAADSRPVGRSSLVFVALLGVDLLGVPHGADRVRAGRGPGLRHHRSCRRRRARRSTTRRTSRSRSKTVARKTPEVGTACSRSAASASPARRRTRACSSSCSRPSTERPGAGAVGAGGRRPAVRRVHAGFTGALVIPFLPPAIHGVGKFGGFKFELLDQSGGADRGPRRRPRSSIVAQGNQTPGLTGLFTQFTANDPQLVVTIDREQAKSLGVSLSDITEHAAGAASGSRYVNDFDFNNRAYRVYVQADQQFRAEPEDIERLLRARGRRAR